MGASKKMILDLIPDEYLPKTILINPGLKFSQIQESMSALDLSYPVILKPDVGERGHMVQLVSSDIELKQYLSTKTREILIQEYLDLPFEVGVFYYRLPDAECGTISSVVVKELLTVIGDDRSTLRELIRKKPRAKLQLKRLARKIGEKLEEVPTGGKVIHLEPIGNHNRGTAFLDGNHLINDELVAVFDKLSKQIDGFFYGRFDLRSRDSQALYNGDFKIMELNGAASEPAHIYSPNYPIAKGYRALFHHWKTLFQISKTNHKLGVPYMTWSDGLEAIKKSRFV